ncbi:MAG: methionine/alanine import family NSS transporter small subunit [Actinomycetaceae bacterium]|nr:methionine/alanine import family NSS transporter small subunit [Actinomycetaceae bacterium]
MNVSAIALMLVSMAIVWGGLAVSLVRLAQRTRAEEREMWQAAGAGSERER